MKKLIHVSQLDYHHDDCTANEDGPCNCGLEEALAREVAVPEQHVEDNK